MTIDGDKDARGGVKHVSTPTRILQWTVPVVRSTQFVGVRVICIHLADWCSMCRVDSGGKICTCTPR